MRQLSMLLVSAFAVLALVSVGTSASAANLLSNPGFETGSLAPWAGVGGLGPFATITVQTPDNGPAAAGIYNAFLNNMAEANGLTMAQTTANGTAAPGLVFYSFDLKTGPTANGGVFFVEIFAQNSVGAVIGGSGLLGNYTPAQWTTFSGSFVAPANTDHLTIQFEAPTGAVTGSVSSMHVDNADLHQDLATPIGSTTWGQLKKLYR